MNFTLYWTISIHSSPIPVILCTESLRYESMDIHMIRFYLFLDVAAFLWTWGLSFYRMVVMRYVEIVTMGRQHSYTRQHLAAGIGINPLGIMLAEEAKWNKILDQILSKFSANIYFLLMEQFHESIFTLASAVVLNIRISTAVITMACWKK